MQALMVETGATGLKKPSGRERAWYITQRFRLGRLEARRKIRRKERRLQRIMDLESRRTYAVHNGVMFDPRLDRAQIVLPELFSLSKNYDETVQTIIQMRHFALSEQRAVMLHFSRLRHIEPAAALALVAEIFRLRNLRGKNSISGTYPDDAEIYNLLCDMGFYNLLNIAEVGGAPKVDTDPNRPAFLRFLSNNRVEAEDVDRFVSIIEKHIVALNELARERLVAAIVEAMANTLDHAHPNPVENESMRDRWWMSSWVNVAAKEVTIVLFDQGVGIPNTLEATAYESIRAALANVTRLRLSATPSDGEMILAATEYHRSGTGSTGRGRGFANMKHFVDVCADGELRVLSNRGSYHYLSRAETYSNAALSLGGTLIEWRFRHDGVVEMRDG